MNLSKTLVLCGDIKHLHCDWLKEKTPLVAVRMRSNSTGQHGGLQDNANLTKSFARRKGESVFSRYFIKHTRSSESFKSNKIYIFQTTRRVTVLQRKSCRLTG